MTDKVIVTQTIINDCVYSSCSAIGCGSDVPNVILNDSSIKHFKLPQDNVFYDPGVLGRYKDADFISNPIPCPFLLEGCKALLVLGNDILSDNEIIGLIHRRVGQNDFGRRYMEGIVSNQIPGYQLIELYRNVLINKKITRKDCHGRYDSTRRLVNVRGDAFKFEPKCSPLLNNRRITQGFAFIIPAEANRSAAFNNLVTEGRIRVDLEKIRRVYQTCMNDSLTTSGRRRSDPNAYSRSAAKRVGIGNDITFGVKTYKARNPIFMKKDVRSTRKQNICLSMVLKKQYGTLHRYLARKHGNEVAPENENFEYPEEQVGTTLYSLGLAKPKIKFKSDNDIEVFGTGKADYQNAGINSAVDMLRDGNFKYKVRISKFKKRDEGIPNYDTLDLNFSGVHMTRTFFPNKEDDDDEEELNLGDSFEM